jgi:multidrug efflux pump subunit AcrA (membrane-fusion protein)
MTSPNPSPRPPRSPSRPRSARWTTLLLVLPLVVGLAGAGYVFMFMKGSAGSRPDLILHKVKLEPLPVSVVGKGALESADNRDIICKVKAGSKGTFSSTIRWVIDDGSLVAKGQLLLELDDSALEESRKLQSIAVEKARAEWVKADKDYLIQLKDNESLIVAAQAALRVAELDLDKFIGLRMEPSLNPFGALAGAQATVMEKGEYRQKLDDVSARRKAAESDLEAYRERSAWADRSAKLGYLTQSQSKVEQAKLSGAEDAFEKLQKEQYILENFLREKDLTDLKSKWDVAKINLEKALQTADAKTAQAESERRTKLSVYNREEDRLTEIEEQVRECKIYAPQDGMVVYYKAEQGRSSSGQQLIAVGEQVREGQKLMRIPDLRRMQVNTRVHEAQVGRIRGDDRQPTHMLDFLRIGMMTGPDPLARLFGQSEQSLGMVREQVRDKEYEIRREGHRATVRVDAFPDRVFAARVRTVAAVAQQADWFSSDVKLYPTQVLITESVVGLKPDMNAEVTIHIDDAIEPVLAVPLQAVVGGAESGPKRTVYVMTAAGPVEREVKLGKFNDAMIEVQSGVAEGEEVIVNPKAVAGDKAKTAEVGNGNGARPKGEGGAPGEGKKGGGEGKKKGGGMPGGPPGGGMPKGPPGPQT